MKRQMFSLAVCLLLFAGLFSISTEPVKSASGDGIVEVDLKIRGTFLRAMDDFPYYGPSDSHTYDENLEVTVLTHTDFRVEEPTMIDLQAEGFNEGDKIYISWLGGLFPDGAWRPYNPGSVGLGLNENENLPHGGLLGLFSTTSQLNPDLDKLNRVSGAIDYGDDFVTPGTWWQDGRPELAEKLASKGVDWYTGSMETDIPEDFRIFPYTGMKVEIPRNAKFLFLSTIDPYYRDNYEGPMGLVVTIEKDTDEDGIPDHWEMNGIDYDHDGTVDLDLPAMGADWEHKDIFVEVDYMGSDGSHDHRPNPTAITDVIQAFANAPVSNPDNIAGINLHVFIDEELPHQNEKSFDEIRAEKVHTFGTAEERTRPNATEAKELVFHYCVFIHKQKGGTWSGIGEAPGNDFLVSLGGFSTNPGTPDQQAATFMHELGHNLGLRHGGDTDTPNYKPNYVSIMNYLFQMDFYVPSRALDFSVGDKPTIREYALDENFGIGDLVKTAWWLTNGTLARSLGALPIDWNADGNITAGVHVNLNNAPSEPSADDNEVFTDYNDWANLFYRFRGTEAFAKGEEPECHEELTWEDVVTMEEEVKNSIEVPTPESSVPTNQNIVVTVKSGDWMEYSASHSGNYPDDLSKRFSMKVEEIDGTKITASGEGQNLDGKDWSIPSETYDLETGFHDLLLIPSGLDVGDQFYHEEFGNIEIQGVENYEYAGEERTVVWATFLGNALHWDQDTGVLCQADWNWSSDYDARWILDKTSLWGQTSSVVQVRGNGKIAFTSTRDGNYEIYVMNADGTEQTRLTNNDADDFDPFYSIDGKKIVFWTNRDGNYEIYVMNSDGTEQTRLTNNVYSDEQPSWSPDGKKIAFPSNRDGNLEIYVMNADGTEQKRLTYNNAADEQPRWSPDGSMIAFNTDRDGNMEIYVMNADGTDQTRITYSDGRDEDPDWSPDGKKFAFFSERDGNCEIYVMNIDGSQPVRLTNSIADDSDPCWSPDGSKITFDSFRDGNWNIYSINADGSELIRLTNNEALDWGPIWQGIEKSAAFPFELIIILAVALCAVIIFILFIIKRKKKKEKQIENSAME